MSASEDRADIRAATGVENRRDKASSAFRQGSGRFAGGVFIGAVSSCGPVCGYLSASSEPESGIERNNLLLVHARFRAQRLYAAQFSRLSQGVGDALNAIPGVSSATFSENESGGGPGASSFACAETILKGDPGLHQLHCPRVFETYGHHFSWVAIFLHATGWLPCSDH